MIRALAAAALVAAVVPVVATAKDPRLCLVSQPAKRSAGCAQHAAELALAAYMKRTGTRWDAVNIYCKTTDPRLLRWSCSWGSQTVGRASVRFFATSSGWHSRVTIL